MVSTQQNPNPQQKLPQKFVAEFDGFRKLTVKERMKILFGFNIKTLSKVIVDRRSGSVRVRTFVLLTKETSPEGQIQNDISE